MAVEFEEYQYAIPITLSSFTILTFAMVFLFMKTHFKLDTSAIITILTYEISLLIRSLSWVIFYIQMLVDRSHANNNST